MSRNPLRLDICHRYIKSCDDFFHFHANKSSGRLISENECIHDNWQAKARMLRFRLDSSDVSFMSLNEPRCIWKQDSIPCKYSCSLVKNTDTQLFIQRHIYIQIMYYTKYRAVKAVKVCKLWNTLHPWVLFKWKCLQNAETSLTSQNELILLLKKKKPKALVDKCFHCVMTAHH